MRFVAPNHEERDCPIQCGKPQFELARETRCVFRRAGGPHLGAPFLAFFDCKNSLERTNPLLWSEIKGFYKDVKNKILHGYQIASNDPTALHGPFDMIRKAHDWVDTRHTLEARENGTRSFRLTFTASEPEVDK
jgi:hypothetical protein